MRYERREGDTYIDLGVLVDDLQEPVHGLVDGVGGEGLGLAEQLAHGVLGAHALGEVADLGEHVVEAVDTVELHVAVQGRGAEVVLEASRGLGLLGAIDPEERVVGGPLDLIDEGAELDAEVLRGHVSRDSSYGESRLKKRTLAEP